MTITRKILTLLLYLATSLTIAAQVNTKTYSVMPIRLPLSMAGDFAEIRPNHFHSGLDIRTEGKEGQPVYAPADGYVSRINISAWGGGKVLYITHPDGYRTVYMHLSAFCGKIGQYVHDYQYNHKLYAFDTELPRDSIKVKKGDLVALSGNSGGSMGPHLHYEIRLAENDQTINPLYFGLPYSDPIAPTIAGIKLYPATPSSTIGGQSKEYKVFPSAKKGSKGDTVSVCGRFFTGIFTYDQMEKGASSRNGVERIELFVDDSLFHCYNVPSFLFEETRAVNALIDYRECQRSRDYYILSRRLRGDPTGFNSVARDNGYLLFSDGKVHKLRYQVSDYKGNLTSRSFYVRSDTSESSKHDALTNLMAKGEPIAYYKPFFLVRDGFTLTVEAGNLYENDLLAYSVTSDAGGISQQHRISLCRNPLPPHDRIHIAMTIPDKVPHRLRTKLVVVCVNGKKTSACPSRIEGDKVVATNRNWGGFALRMDTIAPTIQPMGFADGKVFKGSRLSVKISDNLSGVEKYSCTVNGIWQVVEHDGKTSSLILDGNLLQKGKNCVEFSVTDAVGNSSKKMFQIIRL